MKRSLRIPLTLVLLLAVFLTADPPAKASIPTGTQVVFIFVAVGAVGAAIGVGIYYGVRKDASFTGCATSSSTGLSFENEGDRKSFALIGDTAGIKAGDRIRVRGKKKKDPTGAPTLLVEKLRNVYGPCAASTATP